VFGYMVREERLELSRKNSGTYFSNMSSASDKAKICYLKKV